MVPPRAPSSAAALADRIMEDAALLARQKMKEGSATPFADSWAAMEKLAASASKEEAAADSEDADTAVPSATKERERIGIEKRNFLGK